MRFSNTVPKHLLLSNTFSPQPFLTTKDWNPDFPLCSGTLIFRPSSEKIMNGYSSVSNSSSPYAKYFGMIFPVARSYWDPYDFQKNILQLRRTKFFFKYEGFFNLKTNCLL